MSNIEYNKRVAIDLIEAFSAGDFDLWGSMMAEDANYEIMGNSLMSRTYTRDEILVAAREVAAFFPGGVKIAITGVTAEDDRVALEGKGQACTADGRQYNNNYHLLFIVRNGLITHGREYLCTKLVDQLLVSSG